MFTLTRQLAGRLAAVFAGTGLLLVFSTGSALAANCTVNTDPDPANITPGGTVTFSGIVTGKNPTSITDWDFPGGTPSSVVGDVSPVDVHYDSEGVFQATMNGQDGKGGTCSDSVTVTVSGGGGNVAPTCTINTPVGDQSIQVGDSVNYTGTVTDSDGTIQTITWDFPGGTPSSSSVEEPGLVAYDTAGTYVTTLNATDDLGAPCAEQSVTITVQEPGVLLNQTDYKIMMNYELGMHCTGFEFAYCCVLPVYNSILAQVVKPNLAEPNHGGDFPQLLEGDPNVGLDLLGRQTVVRERALDTVGNFKKYVLRYWHDAQDRTGDPNGKVQTSRLISDVEGKSLFSWNTVFDSAAVDGNGAFITGTYNGATGVILGDDCPDGGTASCTPNDVTDNYQNAVFNHFYIFADPAHPTPLGVNLEGHNSTGTTQESDKFHLGVAGQVEYPENTGAGVHPIGPVDPGDPTLGTTGGPFDNVLTFSGEHGTVVYTQAKVLENLPVMLTSPKIWEALGLPLTPFEDSIDFFTDPGLVDEDSIRPYVEMKAQLWTYDANVANQTPVLDSTGNPVIGFGTAPIDIPNCERCHSNPPDGTVIPNAANEGGGNLTVANSPNNDPVQWAMVQDEYNFWNAYYDIDPTTESDWYSRLKSAAISMLWAHDQQHGTYFTTGGDGPGGNPDFPACVDSNNPSSDCGPFPQNTRLGHEAVICQRCHADNVIAVVKSTNCDPGNTMCSSSGALIMPITEAVHNNHAGNAFTDAQGRNGGCQGCHPAHRSNGDMNGYPITLAGTNLYATADNRDASGGCFVGRDVHSNPGKDTDGAETPEHLNAVGQWLSDNVFSDQGPIGDKGIWCTNCHSQLGQEIWKAENCTDLINGDCINDVRGLPTLTDIANALPSAVEVAANEGVSPVDVAIAWLDPNNIDLHGTGLGDFTNAIWDPLPQPGLCAFLTDPNNPANDANVATIEVAIPAAGHTCSTGTFLGPVDCSGSGGPIYNICGTYDADPGGAFPAGDFSVNILDFCTTDDCVTAAQGTLANSAAVPVPFSAASDGRDHWLAAGEPHCADCHAAPYVEPVGGNLGEDDFKPPFNYPRKASLMRYSTGHQGITCQGCHESIHGLYPVTPSIDTTTYAQAASLNTDGSHGPINCGTCHVVDGAGVPTWIQGVEYNGSRIRTYDEAVSWAHTFTADATVLGNGEVCENCHRDRSSKISESSGKWLRHSFVGRIGRQIQDKAEIEFMGHVAGALDTDGDGLDDRTVADITGPDGFCQACHSANGGPDQGFINLVACTNTTWKNHLIQGRVSESTWETVTEDRTASTCGW